MLIKRCYVLLLGVILSVSTAMAQPGSKEIKRLYKDYLGEVVFSKTPIDLSSFNEAQIQSSFNILDELYFRFFMKQTLAEYYESEGFDQNFSDEKFEYNYAYKVYVNGELQATWLFRMGEEAYFKNVTLGSVLATSNENSKRRYSDIVNPWADMVSMMPDGENTVKIEVVPMNEQIAKKDYEPLATGEFTFIMDTGKLDKFIENRTTGLPDPTVTSPQLEEKILQVAGDAFENATPLKVIITDNKGDWSYTTDDGGFIRNRYIAASVVYNFLTDEQCRVKTVFFSQEHQGNGDFGPVFYDKLAEGYYDYRIPCSKVEN